MKRLELLQQLKESADNREFIKFSYIRSDALKIGCCVIGEALLLNGKPKEFLYSLGDEGITDLMEQGKLKLDDLPFTNEEMREMQELNDEDEWGGLAEYLEELIKKEESD